MSVAFFISGAASLIFEVVWIHRFGLVFGQSVGATSIVLSSFMAGLAFGTALIGWHARRSGNLLRTYAALEIVVAAAGVALTFALSLVPKLVGFIVTGTDSPVWVLSATRFGVSFVALLVPTTAMGATLPVLVGSAATARGSFGRALGQLYGWNTLGAVCGALAAELLLIDRAGIAGCAWIAALMNLGAAAIALTLSSGEAAEDPSASDAPARTVQRDSSSTEVGRDEWRKASVLGCAVLSGAALLALEVVWFRFLSMYVLTTSLTMSVLLAVVLAGIGLGGLTASRWIPRGSIGVASIALMSGCATTVSYLAFQWLTRGVQLAEWYRVAWLACALTVPTSFLSGVLFTALGQRLRGLTSAAGDGAEVRPAAWLTLANTIGAACGAPLAAFVLLPAFGMERTLFAVSALYGFIGILATRTGESANAPLRSPAFVLGAAALLLSLVGFPFGLMTARYFPRVAQPYADDGSTIVVTREGPSETIFLMQQRWLGQPVYSRLVTNGFSMTGTSVPALRYMRYFAYWPMLLHDGPLRKALIICYGAGVTAGAALDLPAIDTVDIVELSPDIVSMSDVIYPEDRHPLHNPRARLHLEDGRIFLQTSRERYDLITGEPPPPRTPGAANIYTREYFQLLYDRLLEGGMTTYWVPVARPNPGTDVNTIIRAFCDVFDDCSLWNATPFDFMLVGTRHATGPVSEATFATAWSTPTLASRLREIGIERPEQVGATFIGDAPFLRRLVAGAPPLTDNFPQRLRPVGWRPSLSDPRYPADPAVVDMYRLTLDPVRARDAFAASTFVKRLWPAALIARSLPSFEEQRMINRVLWEGGRPLAQIEDLHALLTGTTLRTLPLWFLGSDDVKERIAEASEERTAPTEYARALRAMTARDYRRAAAYFGEAERRGLLSETVRALEVYALCLAGDLDTARLLARGSVAATADARHFWDWLRTTFKVEH